MKNQKNKLIVVLLVILCLLTSSVSIYLWQTNQKLKAINSSLLESLIEANNLAKNASTAYKVFGECVTNPSTCDKNFSEQKLIELNVEKQKIEARIQEIQRNLQLLK